MSLTDLQKKNNLSLKDKLKIGAFILFLIALITFSFIFGYIKFK